MLEAMTTATYLNEPDTYFLKEESYEGLHPNFFNPNDFPWVKELESKYEVIMNEIGGLIFGKDEMPANLNPPYLSSPDAWRNFYFSNFRWYDHRNCKKYPKTFAILRSIPNFSFAGITVLEPHSKVLPHIGETNATIRCHFGLKIPGKYLDCGIRVNDEDRGYEEGKVLMFSDAHFHTTWNNTDERRFVIVFDVVQNQFAHKSNWVCASSLSALTIKYIDERVKIIKPLPQFVLSFMHQLIALAWLAFLPVQKRFSLFYS
jgi:ornithine lipid ester-linked acyl 2-hydroxylase